MVCLVKGNCRRGKVEDIKESTLLLRCVDKNAAESDKCNNPLWTLLTHCNCAALAALSLSAIFMCVHFVQWHVAAADDEMVIRCAATSFRFVSCGLVIRVYANCGARQQQQRRSHTQHIRESATRLTSLPRALHNYSARVDFLRKSHATW